MQILNVVVKVNNYQLESYKGSHSKESRGIFNSFLCEENIALSNKF
jgi:hypothetical protein